MSNADVGFCVKPLLSNLERSVSGLLLWKEYFCCDHSNPDCGEGSFPADSTHSTNVTVVRAVWFLQVRKWGVFRVLYLEHANN